MSHDAKKPGVASKMFTIFRENERVLRGFIRRIAPDPQDIDDITQEAVLRALQAERVRTIVEPKAYLFSIVRHVVRDGLERKSRSIIDLIEDFGDQTDFPSEFSMDEQLDARRQLLLFLEAVTSLPQQCQRVFVLKKVYGYSHQEISEKLGISISTTEKHVAAGYKRCSEYMERYRQEKAREAPEISDPASKKLRD